MSENNVPDWDAKRAWKAYLIMAVIITIILTISLLINN